MTLPAKDSFSTYGGVKFDFIDVVDPTTDRSATEINTALASLSMMTRMIPQAVVQIDGYADGPNIYYHEALWGNTSDLKPTVTGGAGSGSTGIYTVTWQPTITDPLDVDQDLALKVGWANISGGVQAVANVTVNSNNTCVVTVRDYAGTPIDIGTSYRSEIF